MEILTPRFLRHLHRSSLLVYFPLLADFVALSTKGKGKGKVLTEESLKPAPELISEPIMDGKTAKVVKPLA